MVDGSLDSFMALFGGCSLQWTNKYQYKHCMLYDFIMFCRVQLPDRCSCTLFRDSLGMHAYVCVNVCVEK